MGAKNNVISVKVDDALNDRVVTYQKQHGLENKSEAARTLLEVGEREQQNPFLFRMKDEVTYWMGQLGIASVIVLLGGFTTPMLAPASAALFSISLIVAAVGLLAGFELLRVFTGMNELGVRWRDLVGGGKA